MASVGKVSAAAAAIAAAGIGESAIFVGTVATGACAGGRGVSNGLLLGSAVGSVVGAALIVDVEAGSDVTPVDDATDSGLDDG